MILVLYGIGESQLLINMLTGAGYRVAAAVRTEYGGVLASRGGAVKTIPVPSGGQEMCALLREMAIQMVIDASHPFNNPVSETFRQSCARMAVEYLRFYRRESNLPDDSLIHSVYSWQEAALKAAEFQGTVFLTTGSNNLDVFVNCGALKGRRVVVRVLPEHQVVKKCRDMGISPRDIVALHGPFSTKFNRAIFQAYKAGVVVTRDGGPSGGTETKIKAALALKIPVVLIRREQPNKYGDPESCEQVLERVRAILPI